MVERRVVVGFNASAESVEGLRWAEAHRDPARERLVVVVVAERTVSEALGVTSAEELKDAAFAHLDDPGGAEVEVVPEAEDVAHALCRTSADADLLVVGARPHSRIGTLLHESVSATVSARARCPVLVVRRPHTTDSRRVVVGFDGSASSEVALQQARDVAGRIPGAFLHAVYAWLRPPADPTGLLDYPSGRLSSRLDDENTRLGVQVQSLVGAAPGVSLSWETVPGLAVAALHDASRDAALLAVGADDPPTEHPRLALGSIALGVLRHAECPVLVAREHRTEVGAAHVSPGD